jgi:hypothetical protein
VAFVAAALGHRFAYAQHGPALEWNVPAQCPSRDVVLRSARELGLPPEATFTLRATVTHPAENEWVLRVDPPFERTLNARTCDELAGAAALYVVWAARSPPPSSPPPVRVLPRVAPPVTAGRTQALLRATFGGEFALMPATVATLAVTAGLRWNDITVEAQLGWPYTTEVTRGETSARFRLWRGVVRGCYTPALTPAWEAGLCLGVEGGSAEAYGMSATASASTFDDTSGWLGALTGITGVWVPWRFFALRASIEAGVVLLAPSFSERFRLNAGALSQEILSVEGFHASALLGAEFRFP